MNSDVGESFGSWTMGDDAAILTFVTSANVACGFHAGDPTGIAQTCRDAQQRGVRIGAHVGYRDLAGFGRRFLDCSAQELADDVLYQIGALDALARAAGSRVSYVKPHGALYNTIVHHPVHAQAVVDAVRAVDPTLPLLVLPGSEAMTRAQAAGLPTVGEAFADRGYLPDGTLVPRSQPGAVIHDPALVAQRVVRFAQESVITAVDGTDVTVDASSVCVHGDTPGAVAMAAAVRQELESAGISLKAFA
ncbi:MAG: 5-oxoprolinase subunit PxpA [Micrococcus sp.]|nr:5-oxoprolinase subunit PxpA [Micrococcus sp.]